MKFWLYLSINCILIVSCAKIGIPTGGEKDETVPKILSIKPGSNSTNVDRETKKIVLQFDEYVLVKNPTEQILISPPTESFPIVKPTTMARKFISIEFNKPLAENTTYVINFGNSIVDNNEGNALNYLNYVFSTGNTIDSLEVKGKLFDPNYVKGKTEPNVLIGLYKIDEKYNDSILIKSKPMYISKLENENTFKVKNLPKGNFRLIVFEDNNKNSMYNADSEKIGFASEPINPMDDKQTTIQLFKAKPNYTIKEAKTTGFGEITFSFKNLTKNIKIEPLDLTLKKQKMVSIKDSVLYWFDSEDAALQKEPVLNFKITNTFLNKIDTVSCIYPKQTKPELQILFQKTSLTPNDKLQLTSNTPIENIKKEKIFLYKIIAKDTLAIPFKITQDENLKNACIDFTPELNTAYLINIFPEAIEDLYGNKNKEVISKKFFPSLAQNYGSVKLSLINKPKHPFFLELYDEKNMLLSSQYTQEELFKFTYLPPGKYALKILVDENEDGIWNTGDVFKNLQPEKIHVYEKPIESRALWDIQEEWILN